MTTADTRLVAARPDGRAVPAALVPRAPTGADPDQVRAALAAARIGAPGGREELAHLLRAAADRYARRVLCLDDPLGTDDLVDAAVARAVRTLPRDLAPDDLAEHLHLAVRHEAFRRQPARSGNPRGTGLLAAAALVLVLVALAAVVVAVARATDAGGPRSEPVVAVDGAASRSLDGRLVDTSSAGTVLGGRADITIEVATDGGEARTVRTDEAGRFALDDLAPAVYEVHVEVPVGQRLRGARDGSTTVVDLSDGSEPDLVLQLQRS